MAFVEWEMQGTELVNCNCSWGCPCQFGSLPTHGDCRAHCFVHIEHGRFGKTSLDGLRWGALYEWPGPIHHGHGRMLAVIDERGDAAQREAMDAVVHGRETEPGSLVWQVFSTTVEHVLPTEYRAIDLAIDVDARTGRLHVPGVTEGTVEPTRNPVTNNPARARMVLPAGFEFTEAEVASGKASSDSAIKLAFDGTHAHLARIHWNTHGVVRRAD